MPPEDEDDHSNALPENEGQLDFPASIELSEDEVPPTDITFECPHCSKSLSIDPRGAGLVILCAQCGQPVTVPIPEGLEIEDFDASPEELSIQLLHARHHIAKQQALIAELELELESLRSFKANSLQIHEKAVETREQIRNLLVSSAEMQHDASALIHEAMGLLAESNTP